MPAPSGVIVGWPGTVASIPTGWSRVTGMDARYPRGAATAGGTGGSNTHSHTSTAPHSHTQTHTHTVVWGATSDTIAVDAAGSSANPAAGGHTHPDGVSSSASPTSGTASPSSSSSNHEPNYYTVIWIKSAGTHDIPQNAIMYWAGSSAPPNHAICTGAGGTPDLRGYFLRGAAAASGGGSRVAATPHSHTAAHSHTGGSHTHSAPTTASDSSEFISVFLGAISAPNYIHSHGSSGTSESSNLNLASNSTPSDSQAPEPPWYKLHHIQKTATSSAIPTGLIALWDGSAESIPSNWAACNGASGTPDLDGQIFIKGASSSAEIGTTGGSSTHSHSITHSHTDGIHTHGGLATTGFAFGSTYVSSSGPDLAAASGHTHSGSFSVSSGNPSSTTSFSLSSVSNAPAYYDVIFIQVLVEPKSDTDSYVLGATESESVVVTTSDTDTLGPVAIDEDESVFSLLLTVNSPTPMQVMTESTIIVDWTLTGDTQFSFRLVVSSTIDGPPVYDSGVVVSATQSAAIPSGILHTGQTYYLQVLVTGNGSLSVVSDWIQFETDFSTSSDVEGIKIVLVGHRCATPELPGVVVNWNAVSPNPDEVFVQYDILRRLQGQPVWTRIAIIVDRTVTRYTDYTVNAGTPYEYAVLWQASTPSGTLVSRIQQDPPVARLEFDWTFLHSVIDPSLWVALEAFDISSQVEQDTTFRRAWGRRAPSAFVGEGFSLTVRVASLPQMRRDTRRWNSLMAIINSQYTVGSVLCLRSGVDKLLVFTVVDGAGRRSANPEQWDGSISLREIYYEEEV